VNSKPLCHIPLPLTTFFVKQNNIFLDIDIQPLHELCAFTHFFNNVTYRPPEIDVKIGAISLYVKASNYKLEIGVDVPCYVHRTKPVHWDV
jgi:hypothetical protein